MAIEEFEMFVKLVLIVILAGIVGYEREFWKKPAGFRTYVLVGISAVLVMICGNKLYEKMGTDPSRIPAQLLSGIGFLGAGTILRDGLNVKGLTTAAGLLAITCIGLIVGAGYYIPAIIATFVVYCVLSYSHFISNKLERYSYHYFKIITQKPKEIFESDIRKIFDEEKIEIVKIEVVDDKETDDYMKIEIRCKDNLDINKLISKMIILDTVKEVIELKQID